MILCTVADDRAGHKGGKFGETQKKIFEFCKKYGIISHFNMWTWDDIHASKYYSEYREMLDQSSPAENGRLYKPLLIKDTLDKIEMGEYLIYNDTSPEMWHQLWQIDRERDWRGKHSKYDVEVAKKLCDDNDGILTTHARWSHNGKKTIGVKPGEPGYHTHDNFTSNLCIEIMGAEKYRYCLQHASGMIVMKKRPDTIDFVDEWVRYNAMPECSGMGIHGLNRVDLPAEGKIGHRHDQSVSGILINRRNGGLVKKLGPNEQHQFLNPNNFLNFCQKNTSYSFFPANTERKDKIFRRVGPGESGIKMKLSKLS